MDLPKTRDDARVRPEQFILFSLGGLLVLGGGLHVLVWLIAGGSLDGPVSWRKPILFGFSGGVTVISIGWLAGKLKRRAGDLLLFSAFAIAMVVEVGLITLQQWRGTPSHFNRSTPFDASVLVWIESLILLATIVIADVTQRCWRPLRTDPDMTLAIRGGMLLLLLSCLLGFVLVAYGNHQVSLGRPPSIFGRAGVMKFPHGAPMHAIQILPALAWFLRLLKVGGAQRLRAVACAFASLVVFTIFSILQTFSGRARFDLWWFSGLVLAAAASLMSVTVYIGASHVWRRIRGSLE
jgi:hypothetical protein